MTFEERVMACLKFRTRKYVEHVRAKAFTDEYRDLEWDMIADLCRCLDIPARALGLIMRKWIRNPDMDAVEQEIKAYFDGVLMGCRDGEKDLYHLPRDVYSKGGKSTNLLQRMRRDRQAGTQQNILQVIPDYDGTQDSPGGDGIAQ